MSQSLGQIYSRLTLDLRNFNENLALAKRSTLTFEADFKKTTKKMGKSMGSIFGALKNASKQFKKSFESATQSARGNIGKMGKAVDDFASRAGKKIAGTVSGFATASRKWTDTIERGAKRAETAVDRLTKKTKQFGQTGKTAAAGVRKGLQDVNKTAQKTKGIMITVGQAIKTSFTFAAAAMLRRSIAALTRDVIEFEDSMATVHAVMKDRLGPTAKGAAANLAKLSDKARELGRDTIFTAAQVASGMEQMARSGMPVNDVLNSMSDALDLAQAGGVSFKEGTDIMINALKQFQMDADQSTRVADVLSKTTANFKTDLRDLGMAMSYVGGVAHQFNISFEGTAVALGHMSNMGLEASRAGTTLRRIIVGLHKESQAGIKVLKKYGLTYEQIATINTGSLAKSFVLLKKAGVSTNDMLKLFQIRGTQGALVLKQMAEQLEYAEDGMRLAQGTAKEMAKIMGATLSKEWLKFRSAVTDIAISIGTILIPALSQLLRHITSFVKWVGRIAKWVTDLMGKIPGLTTAIELLAGALIAMIAIRVTWFLANLLTGATTAAKAMFTLAKATKAVAVANTTANLTGMIGKWGKFGGVIGRTAMKMRTFGLNTISTQRGMKWIGKMLPGGATALAGLGAVAVTVGAAFLVWANNIRLVMGWLKRLGDGSIGAGINNVFSKFVANVQKSVGEAGGGPVNPIKAAWISFKAGFDAIEDAAAETTQKKSAEASGAGRTKWVNSMIKKMKESKFKGISRYKALSDDERIRMRGIIADPKLNKDYKKKLQGYFGGVTEQVDPTWTGAEESPEEKRLKEARSKGSLMKKQFELEKRQRAHVLTLREKEDELIFAALASGKEGIDQAKLMSGIEDERHQRAQARMDIEIENLQKEISAQKELEEYYLSAGLEKEALDAKLAQQKAAGLIKEKVLVKEIAIHVNRRRLEEEKTTETIYDRNRALEIDKREISQRKGISDLQSQIVKEKAIRKGATDEDLYKLAYEQKKRILGLDQQILQTELASANAALKAADHDIKAAKIALDRIDIAKHELQLLAQQNVLLDEQLQTFMARDMMNQADAWATAWTDAFGSIIDQLQSGQFEFADTISQLGQNIMESAVKPLLESIQEELNKLFINVFEDMSSTMRNTLSAVMGGVLMGIGSWLKGQKEDVESLADNASQEIVDNTEKIRGLVAGEQTIGIAKMSENLGMAFRPTNALLVEQNQILREGLGVKSKTTDTPSMTVTNAGQNGGFAMEVIGASRV